MRVARSAFTRRRLRRDVWEGGSGGMKPLGDREVWLVTGSQEMFSS